MDDDHDDDKKAPNHTPEPSTETAETPQVLRVGSPGGRRKFLHSLSTAAAIGATVSSCEKDKGTTPTARTTTTTTSTNPTFTLSGVVTDPSGKAVVGARCVVYDGPNANKSATTDGNGFYSISGLVAGGFTLQIIHNDVVLYNQGITLLQDTRLDFRVTTTSTSVSTTVKTTVKTTAESTAPTSTPGGGGTTHYWYPN